MRSVYLEDAGDDGTDVGGEPFSKGEGQVDEHHDIAIPHMRRNVHLTGSLHHVWHQLVQLLHSQASHDLRQTCGMAEKQVNERVASLLLQGAGGKALTVVCLIDQQQWRLDMAASSFVMIA